MTIVTQGVVSIEDAQKHPGYDDPQFAPARKVRVELTFQVTDGSDEEEVLNRVSALAEAKVKELLGSNRAEKKPTARTKPKPIEVVLPAETTQPSGGSQSIEKTGTTAAVDMSEFDAEIPASSEPITDKELHEKARQRADALGNSVPIRKLIGTFAPAGATSFQLIQIPQERRREFLDKLAKVPA